MTYTLNGIDYDSASEENLPIKEFYRQLREGGESKTAQVSLDKATSAFEKLVEEGYDVFHLAFSSALSGTYQSCTVAANDVMERHPEAEDHCSGFFGRVHGAGVDAQLRRHAEGAGQES